MEKFKIILNYVLGFILSLLVLCIILFGILKCTVFNPNYIKNALNKNNYYETIETNIHESMEAYMMSSGLPNDILNNLYTKKEIKNEVDNFIDNLFNGQINKTEENKIKEKLTNNINTYLQNNNLTVSDKETLDSFITEMTQIYKDNITLYGMIDNYAGMFSKIGHLINIAVLMLVITIIILVILLILIKGNGYEAILTASGIMLLFVKFIIYDRIDYNNIVIISDSFSKVLNYILNNIGILMIIFGLLLTIVGILTAVIKLLKKK